MDQLTEETLGSKDNRAISCSRNWFWRPKERIWATTFNLAAPSMSSLFSYVFTLQPN